MTNGKPLSGSHWLTIAMGVAVTIGGFIASTMYSIVSTNSIHRVEMNVKIPDLIRRIEILEREHPISE